MRTIRVTGKGQIKVAPDMTRITLELSGLYPEYTEAVRQASQDTEQVRDLLADFGFDRSDLKTLYFNVYTEYETYNEKGAYKKRFIGYKYNHRTKVEFSSDNDRLGKILYALVHGTVTPEISLSYFVEDPEAVRNELVGRAAADAREKALALTKAAGAELLRVQSIDCSRGQMHLEVNPTDRLFDFEGDIDYLEEEDSLEDSEQYDMNIEPDDIEVSDTVTIVWEIV